MVATRPLATEDAARVASAITITAVIPHFAYARSDKKDAPRISIGAWLVADMLAGLACTHGLFTGAAIERRRRQTDVDRIVITRCRCPGEAAAHHGDPFGAAEAVRRIHLGASVGSLFSDVEMYG